MSQARLCCIFLLSAGCSLPQIPASETPEPVGELLTTDYFELRVPEGWEAEDATGLGVRWYLSPAGTNPDADHPEPDPAIEIVATQATAEELETFYKGMDGYFGYSIYTFGNQEITAYNTTSPWLSPHEQVYAVAPFEGRTIVVSANIDRYREEVETLLATLTPAGGAR